MIAKTLACALLLLDDFTGRPLYGAGALFRGAGGLVSPIRRRDGYYLFLENGGEAPDLDVKLPGYLDRRFRPRAEDTAGRDRLLRLRMYRAFPGGYGDCGWLEGTGPPGTEVIAVSKAGGNHSFRMKLGERDGERELGVSGYIARQLCGLCYAAENGNGELADFTLEEKLDNGAYRVGGLPDWRSEDAIPFRRAYRSLIAGSGEYHIPIDPGAEIQSIYVREGGRWVFCS